MFAIENKLLLLYRRVKWMHYPESPKVTLHPTVESRHDELDRSATTAGFEILNLYN